VMDFVSLSIKLATVVIACGFPLLAATARIYLHCV
jgi:hypothetical protein